MKRSQVINIIVIIASALLIILVVKYFLSREESNSDTYQIGAVLPLTGEVAVYGNNTKKGIDLAVEYVNNNGGVNGKQLEVIYEDSKAEPKTGVSAINKLIISDNIQVVIDNSVSSVALAMEPIATKNAVLLLSTGSTSPTLSGISDYFFRIWNSDDLEGKFSANFILDSLKITEASVIYINNDYGIGIKNVFENEFLNNGGNQVDSYAYEQNSKDFISIITKVIGEPMVYIVGYTNDNATIIKKLSELGYKGHIVGTVTMEDNRIIDLCGEAANGVIYPFPIPPDTDESNVNLFNQLFREVHNEAPGITADVGFDAILLIAKALGINKKLSGHNLSKIFAGDFYLYGASGEIKFDQNGDVSKPMRFKKIFNSQFINY